MSAHRLSIADVTAPQLPDSGDFIYRITQPGAAVGAMDGITSVSFTNIFTDRERLFREADVLVIHMIGDPDLLPVILERRRAGRLTVFEVSDNFMDFQPSNPATAFYEDPANRACLIQLLSLCHAMQTTMPEIQRRFSRFNPRCGVFMNQMQSLGSPERSSGGVTVGWGGSLGHYDDIRRIAPSLTAWLMRHPDATFAIMADEKITDLFNELPRNRIRIARTGSLADYYAFVQTLDVGIAPVREEEFNLCRSDVKFMEYASRGVVPVCSGVPTYSRTVRDGDTGFLFRDEEEMLLILDRLAGDEYLRRRVGKAAYDYIANERSERACAEDRILFYESAINELGLVCGNPLPWVNKHEKAGRTPGTNHFLMQMGKVEKLIYNGLITQYRAGKSNDAIKYFSEAARLAPDFYPARFFLGNVLLASSPQRAVKELDAAIGLKREAIAAPMLLARAKAGAGDMEGTLKILRKIQKDVPEFAPAWSFEGDICKNAGKRAEAMNCWRRSLEENPYFAPAAIMSGIELLGKSEFREAAEKFSIALETAPRSGHANVGMGVALLKLGDERGAAGRFEFALAQDSNIDDAVRYLMDIMKKHYKNGEFNSAEKILKRLVELRANDAEPVFWLARTLEKSGQKQRAADTWRLLSAVDSSGKYAEITKSKLGG